MPGGRTLFGGPSRLVRPAILFRGLRSAVLPWRAAVCAAAGLCAGVWGSRARVPGSHARVSRAPLFSGPGRCSGAGHDAGSGNPGVARSSCRASAAGLLSAVLGRLQAAGYIGGGCDWEPRARVPAFEPCFAGWRLGLLGRAAFSARCALIADRTAGRNRSGRCGPRRGCRLPA